MLQQIKNYYHELWKPILKQKLSARDLYMPVCNLHPYEETTAESNLSGHHVLVSLLTTNVSP